MLPEELESDLRQQGFRITKFSIDMSTGGKRIAHLVLKARRGQLDADDRKIASQVVSFNLPQIDIYYTPLGSNPSNDMILSWLV